MGPLRNPRHERFCLALAEGKPASTAYVEAGYSPHDGNCIRLRGNERVKARLAELQLEARRDSAVTVASLLGELEQARSQATDLKQFSAVVRSIESKARISGLLTEKIEIKTADQRFERCRNIDDVADQFRRDYEAEGYVFDEKDHVELLRLTRVWWEDLRNLLDASKAKPVSSTMTDQQRENVERRRLGLAVRPAINGSQR